MTRESPRGESRWVDWSPGRGSEQVGRRPALVVQTDAANRNARYPAPAARCLPPDWRGHGGYLDLDPPLTREHIDSLGARGSWRRCSSEGTSDPVGASYRMAFDDFVVMLRYMAIVFERGGPAC